MHAFKAPSSFRSQHKTVGRRSLKVVEARNKQHRLNKSAPKLSVYESRLGKVQLVFQLPIFAIYHPNTRTIRRISTGKNPKTRLSFATHPHIDTTGKEQLSLSSVVTVGFTLQHSRKVYCLPLFAVPLLLIVYGGVCALLVAAAAGLRLIYRAIPV